MSHIPVWVPDDRPEIQGPIRRDSLGIDTDHTALDRIEAATQNLTGERWKKAIAPWKSAVDVAIANIILAAALPSP